MTRVVSGVILATAALAAILFLPFLGLRILTCIIAVLATREYVRIVGCDELGIVVALVACWFIAGGDAPILASAWVLVPLCAVWSVMWRNQSMQSAAAGAFAAVYIGMPLGMLAAVQRTFGAPVTLMTIATIVVSDSAQYYTGRAFGRHPLAPTISPKKTIEGAVGGLVFGSAFLVAAGVWWYDLPIRTMVPFAVLVVVLGIVGDLFESRLKRAAGVKDSSTLIPGHGGVLDRIDALLFAAPAFYLYFKA